MTDENNPPSLKAAVQAIFDRIARRQNRARADTLLAEECSGPNSRADISVYAVRMWLTRGIPRKHWPTVARLAGVKLSELERMHR